MAVEVVMPRQGNTVESCIILGWKKREGDAVQAGEALCEVETDKATFEVEAPEDGTLLKILHEEGEDVPVLQLIAIIGEQGEDIEEILQRTGGTDTAEPAEQEPERAEPAAAEPAAAEPPRAEKSASVETGGTGGTRSTESRGGMAVSPRARRLAESHGIDTTTLSGSGPHGRVIERDVQAAADAAPRLTGAAADALRDGGVSAPAQGSGLAGRVTTSDLPRRSTKASAAGAGTAGAADLPFPGPVTEEAVTGVRKRIAERMRASLSQTAQLTLNSWADARALLSYRARLKAQGERRGVGGVSLNDMILFVVARSLGIFPEMNAHFLGEKIVRFERVHLGFAVDTPRGLMVPVIKNADLLTLKQISTETKRLASSCQEGKVSPDELAGATFTVTNLGAAGVSHFTPVLNPPQVGILGVGGIELRPVEKDGEVEFVKQIALSLTIDHQAVDGAPGARFLAAVAQNAAEIDLLLAG